MAQLRFDYKTKKFIALTTLIVIGILIGFFLLNVFERLDTQEEILLVLALFAISSMLDVAYAWWHQKVDISAKDRIANYDVIGKPGVVVQACRPEGVVKIGYERWKATSLDGDLEIDEKIIVKKRDGLTVYVAKSKN